MVNNPISFHNNFVEAMNFRIYFMHSYTKIIDRVTGLKSKFSKCRMISDIVLTQLQNKVSFQRIFLTAENVTSSIERIILSELNFSSTL